jgi:hypothetical protein
VKGYSGPLVLCCKEVFENINFTARFRSETSRHSRHSPVTSKKMKLSVRRYVIVFCSLTSGCKFHCCIYRWCGNFSVTSALRVAYIIVTDKHRKNVQAINLWCFVRRTQVKWRYVWPKPFFENTKEISHRTALLAISYRVMNTELQNLRRLRPEGTLHEAPTSVCRFKFENRTEPCRAEPSGCGW